MHDGGGETREQTVEALPRVIDGLRAHGLETLPLREVLRAREEWIAAARGDDRHLAGCGATRAMDSDTARRRSVAE